jgi:pimeloyl-ACP methyl ester carboxylesterase
MTTFVLVHGAWHGGWCWRKVTERLRAAGHDVHAPTLTGLGDRLHLANPDVDLDTHIADVIAVMETEELSDVILCGHSYGGMVITGVADRAARFLSGLVYLDAFVPPNGSGLEQMLPPERQEANLNRVAEQGEGWRIAAPENNLWGIVAAEDRAWVERRIVEHPFKCMTQPLTHGDPWMNIANRTFVLATGNPASPFHAIADGFRADPGWHFESVDCGHDVMVDEPDVLVEILQRAAAR